MARCGCSGECNCVVTEGDCTTVTGNGNPGTPYVINVKIDDDASNQLTCVADAPGDEGGLYVPPPTIEVADTDCIAMSGTGTALDPVEAEPILNPSNENLLACGVSGLMADLVYTDGGSVNFSGRGNAGSPLTAEVTASPDVGNVVQIRGNGVFVPTGTVGTLDIYGSLGRSGGYASPGGVGVVTVGPFPFDTVQQDNGTITDVAGSRFLVPVGGAGWYHLMAKWRESVPGDSFEATGDYYQVRVAINGSGRIICAKTVDLLCDLPQEYWVEDVVYLNVADSITCSLTITESTGLLAIAARTYDVVAYGDGTYPCAFECERIGV